MYYFKTLIYLNYFSTFKYMSFLDYQELIPPWAFVHSLISTVMYHDESFFCDLYNIPHYFLSLIVFIIVFDAICLVSYVMTCTENGNSSSFTKQNFSIWAFDAVPFQYQQRLLMLMIFSLQIDENLAEINLQSPIFEQCQ